MKTVLTIAGFDPSSGAGVTADLMVFAAHGLFGTSCITALTVQSTVGVRSTHPTSAAVVGATLDCLNDDLPPAGIKIGMIATEENVIAISDFLQKINAKKSVSGSVPIVLDPVLRSTSGRDLLDPAAVTTLRERLLPLVDWITPNLAELAILSGEPVATREDLPRASRTLQNQIAQRAGERRMGIFATGGHLDPPDDLLLLPDGESLWLPGERVVTRSTHGTGCSLSSAFLARLVLGDAPRAAAESAKYYVAKALETAVAIGSGISPVNNLWKLSKSLPE
ncbi:MAG: bifunctional hydroxymethylpyrimidine kinase/phosphomethylpyrimidine kinase [Acidobacteriaceae bacterium]|nr:bifunctional hydroxymethylpyrimidine kinase/phosphomethylpyrimidine kinase [Acidobacteriaceae bacterium]